MPKRAAQLQAQTPVQGEDSYVKYTLPVVNEVEEILQYAQEVSVRSWTIGRKLIIEHIKDWNWVDSDGSPLPIPSEDPDVVGRLTYAEYNVLLEVMLGNEETRKN